jgi:hypothetical protein
MAQEFDSRQTDDDRSTGNSTPTTEDHASRQDDARTQPDWAAAIDRQGYRDSRKQPWKNAFKGKTKDTYFLGYKKWDSEDKDYLKDPKDQDCQYCGGSGCVRCGQATFTG